MSEAEEISNLNAKPGDSAESTTSLPRTIISLLFFVLLYYWLFKSWMVVIALVVVLLIHESGHFAAMKFFGYKGVNMTFVPFVGAYVSGRTTDLSNRNKMIVLLAGPVPGVIIGSVLLLFHHYNHQQVYFLFAIIFLLQNTFNLLPVLPLDGGQFFEALFFGGGKVMQLIFLYLSLALVIFVSFYWKQNWAYLLLTLPLIFKIFRTHHTARIHKKLDAACVDYACTYDDLTDDEYWQIRNVVVEESKILSRKFTTGEYAGNEHELIPFVESILVRPFEDKLTSVQKLLFLLIWAIAFATPILIWAWHSTSL